jgi:hypothetical protein
MFSEQARAFLLAARDKLTSQEFDDWSKKQEKERKKKGGPMKTFYPKLTDIEIQTIAKNLGEAVKLEKDVQQMVCLSATHHFYHPTPSGKRADGDLARAGKLLFVGLRQ